MVFWSLTAAQIIALNIALIGPCAARAASASEALSAGRTALTKGELAQALTGYHEIKPIDELWSEKAEDLLRHELRSARPLEAWRIIQLGKRVKRDLPTWSDYERLALLRAGACPLAMPGGSDAMATLLRAAAYRRMARPGFAASVSLDSNASSSLGPGVTPYLRDIPQMKLVKGQGCRIAKVSLVNGDVRMSELKQLVQFLEHHEAPANAELLALPLVAARAVWLAGAVGKGDLKSAVAARFAKRKGADWTAIPESERRVLFRAVFDASRLSDLGEDLKPAAREIARSILRRAELSASTESPADWLAFADLDAMSAHERIATLVRLEKVGSFQGRGWVLARLAFAYRDAEREQESLAIVRRLLVESEESIEETQQTELVEMVADIFSAFRSDTRMMGAFQAAIPGRLWGGLLERARLRAAFDGRSAEFTRLASLERKSGAGRDWSLAAALAKRNLREFTRLTLKTAQGDNRDLASMAGTMASRLLDATQAEATSLAPYADALLRELESAARKSSDPASSSDLAQALAAFRSRSLRGGNGLWLEGSSAIRSGAVNAGVARARPRSAPPDDFKIESPAILPERELVYVPADAVGRAWEFSAAPL